MRFFGSKLRESHSRKRDGQQHHPLVASSGEGAEVRTDVANKRNLVQQPVQQQSAAKANDSCQTSRALTLDSNQNQLRLQQQQQTASSQSTTNGVHSSIPTAVSSPRDKKESHPSNNSIGIGKSTGGLSPRSLRAMISNTSSQGSNARPVTTTAPKTTKKTITALASSPNQASKNINGGGTRAIAPPSILHRNKRLAPTTNVNAAAAAAAAHNNGSGHQRTSIPPQTTSFDIAPLPVTHNPRVRFMSAGSVTSNSEASQVHLMAGAAGSVASSSAMSSADNNRDNVFDRVLHMVMAEEHERLNAMGMSRADSKNDVVKPSSSTKKTTKTSNGPPVLSVETIEIDTGSHIIGKNIDLDTSTEVEYHDRNDNDVPEERWTKLNDAALASGMQSLTFDSISPQGSDTSSSHCRLRRGTHNTKTKKLGDTDHTRDDWVAFDGINNNVGSKKNSDTTRRVNGLASF